MSQSLTQIYIHLVYSTKHRRTWLDPDLRPNVYAYKGRILRNRKCSPILINGVEDHVHLLFRQSKGHTIEALTRDLKSESSKWLKNSRDGFADFAWQGGYAAFSVSPSKLDDARDYIARQEEHHRTMTFQEELRILLDKHGIEYDERYLWD